MASQQTVLITGCSGGIGLESALAFARAGYSVTATVREHSRGARLQALAAAQELDIAVEVLDVTAPVNFVPFVERLLSRLGRLDVLVNNAGVLPVGAFEDIPEAEFRATMEANFFGPALLSRAVLPVMRQQRSGYIIMVSSLSGIAAKAGDAVYAASKFALDGLTEALRQEVMRWNIRTALVHPAQYTTGMFRLAEAGTCGSCAPDSPYRPLIEYQQRLLRQALARGRDPALLADLLVRIASSDGSRFRWAADDLAEHVTRTLFAQDDAARQAFLREVSDADWWMTGEEPPGDDRKPA